VVQALTRKGAEIGRRISTGECAVFNLTPGLRGASEPDPVKGTFRPDPQGASPSPEKAMDHR